MPDNATPSPPLNLNIQALRAIAAVGVLLHHMLDSVQNYLAPAALPFDPRIGSYGVELFFVISGYVMMMVSSRKQQTAGQFLRDRIVRIVPLYWLLTLLACIPLLVGLRIFGNTEFSAIHLLTSLLFIPPTAASNPPFPILFVGWTLNYEMMFYALFALAIAWVKPAHRAVLLSAAIAALVGLAAVTNWQVLDFSGDAIIIGFAMGVLLWELQARTHIRPGSAATAIVAGVVALVLLDIGDVDVLDHGRGFVSLAAALVVWGAVSLDRDGISVGRGFLSHLGDASYALYLTHPFVLQFVGKAAIMSGINASAWGLAIVLLVMAAGSIIVALLVHRHLEKPMMAALREWKGWRKASQPSAL